MTLSKVFKAMQRTKKLFNYDFETIIAKQSKFTKKYLIFNTKMREYNFSRQIRFKR
jgi:hypothetical protein